MAWLSGMLLGSLALVQVGLISLIPLTDGHRIATAHGTGLVPLDYKFYNPAVWALAFLLPLGFVPLTLVVSRALLPIDGRQGGAGHASAAE